MTSFLDRAHWGAPVPISDDLAAVYDVAMDWDKILDYLERGQEEYKIGSAQKKNFTIDYSGWDARLESDEVLTLALFDEIISRNSYIVMPALSDKMSFTFGELAEVVRG